MGDDVGTLSNEQLTRLAQYFDERVTYPAKYKRFWVAFPRSALGGPRAPTRTDEWLRVHPGWEGTLGHHRRRSDDDVGPLGALQGVDPA